MHIGSNCCLKTQHLRDIFVLTWRVSTQMVKFCLRVTLLVSWLISSNKSTFTGVGVYWAGANEHTRLQLLDGPFLAGVFVCWIAILPTQFHPPRAMNAALRYTMGKRYRWLPQPIASHLPRKKVVHSQSFVLLVTLRGFKGRVLHAVARLQT